MNRLVLVFAAAAVSCTPSGTALVSKRVGAGGGTLELPDATLTVPAGALSAEVEISIGRTRAAAPQGYAARSALFSLQPDGTAFSTPATLTLKFTGSADGLTVFLSDGASAWTDIGGAVSGDAITAQVSHFSIAFAGTQAVADGGGGDAGADGGGGGGAGGCSACEEIYATASEIVAIDADDTHAYFSTGAALEKVAATGGGTTGVATGTGIADLRVAGADVFYVLRNAVGDTTTGEVRRAPSAGGGSAVVLADALANPGGLQLNATDVLFGHRTGNSHVLSRATRTASGTGTTAQIASNAFPGTPANIQATATHVWWAIHMTSGSYHTALLDAALPGPGTAGIENASFGGSGVQGVALAGDQVIVTIDNVVRKRPQSGSGFTTIYTSTANQGRLTRLVADATRLYWIEDYFDGTDGASKIMSSAHDGTGAAALADGFVPEARLLAQNATHLFAVTAWGPNEPNWKIWRVAK
jgi:hypothetical protein